MKLADAVKVAKSFKVDHARKFAHHVVPEVVRPARVIWNQAIGGIFLFLALVFFGNGFRYLHGFNAPPSNPVALAFSVFLGMIMLYFGWSSFRTARRIGQRSGSRLRNL